MRTYLMCLSFIFIFISCKKDSQDNAKSIDLTINEKVPNLNFSSPDLTVKSFIKYREWLRENYVNTIEEFGKISDNYFHKFYTEEFPDSFKNPINATVNGLRKSLKESLQIENVDIQSNTRAVVIVETSEKTFGYNHDIQPVKERYTLSNEDNKVWLIELYEITCMNCDGTGSEYDFQLASPKKFSICKICNGTGWVKNKMYLF